MHSDIVYSLEDENRIGLLPDSVLLSRINNDVLVKYFNIEKTLLKRLLQSYVISIEHIGSTAVPGLLAKPIIDIAVGIEDFRKSNEVRILLEQSDFQWLRNRGSDTRLMFVRRYGKCITHHIHVEEYLGEEWNNQISFRDRIIDDIVLRKEYEMLKIQLYAKYSNNRNKYTEGKTAFIKKVLSLK